MQEIRDSTPFAGSDTLTMGQGSCSFTVTNTGVTNRIITASSTVGTIIRKAKITINQINPRITVTSWQEVEGF